ncbi:hypothetical protein [Clostridium cylindrosporum]|uniref:Glycerophosphoryl diester phosphodiesterase membrane domain-containing protein n=1 Tax=Clostridium cylindrosporum DSM 605 TaxID=1121307 RepID=A0A0J8G4Z1_CLOCY|nr:hypothetical protein [Clostridium cylindrosporum]KMT22741.1 hypothetical protein CLCY_11c00750 [Clostridium cylindrosporum DSM 605]
MFIGSFKVFFKNLKLIVPFIIYVVLFSIPYFIIGKTTTDFDPFTGVDLNNSISFFYGLIIGLIIFILLSVILGIIIQCWTVHMSVFAVKNENYTLLDSLKKSFKYFWRILGLSAIQFSITALVGFFAFATFSLVVAGEALGTSSYFLPIIFGVLIVALIIFFTVTLSPITCVIINDDLSLDRGFSIGFKLGLNKFFKILGFYALIIIIISLVYYPYLIAIDSYDYTITTSILDIIIQIISYILVIILNIYIIKLYNNSKIDNVSKDTSSKTDTLLETSDFSKESENISTMKNNSESEE